MLQCPGQGSETSSSQQQRSRTGELGRGIMSQVLWDRLHLHSSGQNCFLLSRQVIPAVCGE